MKKSTFALLLSCLTLCSYGQSMEDFPKEVQMVFNYILKIEYLELYGDSTNSYQFRPVEWSITDIDKDGKTEVFLLIYPHYCQTAPIQIYQIQPDSTVKRIKESLAPGNPVIRTDEYLDSHNEGYAGDIAIGKSATKEQKRKLVESSMKYGMTIIEFPDFFHTDKRIDEGGGYVDLSHSNYKNEHQSCSAIQLAKPATITSGKLKNKPDNYFAVVIDQEIWIYKITKIDDSGFLEKEVVIVKLPKDFNHFSEDEQYISYRDKKGKLKQVEGK